MRKGSFIDLAMGVVAAIGGAVVLWVGAGFLHTNPVATSITALVAIVYLAGVGEIFLFHRENRGLADALARLTQEPPVLDPWLANVPDALRGAVRLRIEGERVSPPALLLSPYLVGLLVMLGMLGTFLGVVLTFKGAVLALEGSADLQAIRQALAGPIRGLAFSFGTSVAGVASSAMLGLMAAIARQERAGVWRSLETHLAGGFRAFSLAERRAETFRALQEQAVAMPVIAERLREMLAQIEERNRQLATSVEQSIVVGVSESARAAAAATLPVVESAMASLREEAARIHERVASSLEASLAVAAERVEQRGLALLAGVEEAQATSRERQLKADEHLRTEWNAALTGVLGEFRAQAAAQREADAAALLRQDARMEQLTSAWRSGLSELRAEESDRGRAAGQRMDELQAAFAVQLAALGAALEAPIERLLRTSAEVPKAAAELIAELRAEMSHRAERDNFALQERAALLAGTGEFLESARRATEEQRDAIASLVVSAGDVLGQAGVRLSEALDGQTARAEEAARQVSGSAIEVAALAEALGHGVELFSASNERLVESLQRIEGAIGASLARSDEQLAYYVAQAREVIDLSIGAQKGILDDLRQLRGREMAVVQAAAVSE